MSRRCGIHYYPRIGAVIVTGLLVSTLALFLIASVAGDDTMRIIVVSPSGTVPAGTLATIDIHVFDSGEHKDPTTITATDSDGNPLDLKKKATGVMTGSVISSVDERVWVEARMDTMYDTDLFFLQTDMTSCPQVDIEAEEPLQLTNPKAGSVVNFLVHSTLDGIPYDTWDLSVVIRDYRSNADDVPLALTKVSTGEYSARYTVPEMNSSGDFSVGARIMNDTCVDWDWEDLTFFFYQVWYHKISVTSTLARFEVYVNDLEGNRVPGALIRTTYEYEIASTNRWVEESVGLAETDKDGRALVTLSYTDVADDIYIYGTATVGDVAQRFSGTVYVSVGTSSYIEEEYVYKPPSPIPEDFRVEFIGDEYDDYLIPGTVATTKYYAYMDGKVYANSEIVFYAYTYKEVVRTGKVQTDDEGFFFLSMTVPEIEEDNDYLTIVFQEYSDSGHWRSWVSHHICKKPYSGGMNITDVIDSTLDIKVDGGKAGEVSTVTIRWQKAVEGSNAEVLFVSGDVKASDLANFDFQGREWGYWTSEDQGVIRYENGVFTGPVIIPEFLPEGTYTLLVVVYNPEGSDDQMAANCANIEVRREAAEEQTPGLGLWQWLGGLGLEAMIIIVAVVIVLIVGLLGWRRRQGRRKVRDEGIEEEEEMVVEVEAEVVEETAEDGQQGGGGGDIVGDEPAEDQDPPE